MSGFPIFEEVSTSGSKDKILYFPKRGWKCLLPVGWYCKKKFIPVLCLIFFIFEHCWLRKISKNSLSVSSRPFRRTKDKSWSFPNPGLEFCGRQYRSCAAACLEVLVPHWPHKRHSKHQGHCYWQTTLNTGSSCLSVPRWPPAAAPSSTVILNWKKM